MSGPLIPPGKKAFTASQLREFIDGCKACDGNGWIQVAYEIVADKWQVYRFPCKCIYDGGLYTDECISAHRYRREPDYEAADLGNKVFIHPRLSNLMFTQIKERIAIKRGEAITIEDLAVPF